MRHKEEDSGKRAPGVAVVCDLEGNVLEVIRDDLGFAESDVQGRPFALLVDRASLGKALSLLVELRAQGAVFGWELNVPLGGQVTTLHFAGAANDDWLLIVGARTCDAVRRLSEDLIEIGSEQMNALRATVKERAELAHSQAEKDSALYDELSRLNNESANLQRQMAKQNVELARLNEQKNQFLGMAAHDLRNPLSIIRVYSDFLIDEAADMLGEEHSGFLAVIRRSSEFMLQMVDDLLDFAEIESGRLQLDLHPEDMAALVGRNVALNQVLAARKGIELILVQDGEIPNILADGSKIEQVLNNLIGNAVKFSYPDSTVQVCLSCENGRVVISVSDEGPGIPAGERDSLFQPFTKTSVKSTGGEKGTGLGLAIVRRIVLGHGGEIWVESEVGEGTRFYVSLPAHQEEAGT
jgi:signal transduction histidine kinase